MLDILEYILNVFGHASQKPELRRRATHYGISDNENW